MPVLDIGSEASGVPLVTVDDVAEYMGLTIVADSREAKAVATMIDGLQADLETYLGRPLVVGTYTEQPTTGRNGSIRLRFTPVHEVTEFTVGGVAVDATSYTVKSWGIGDLVGVFWPSPLVASSSVVGITYSAGLKGDDPDDPFGRKVRGMLLRAVARELNQVVREDAAGVSRFSVEGTSISFVGEGGWLPSELESLRRWKKRTART